MKCSIFFIKLLEENMGRTLNDINQSKILYDTPPRVMGIKIKVNKWDLIKQKILHSKGNYKQDEKTALRMGENNSKWDNWERINFQNIQATQKTQYQKNKQPNQKVGKRPFHLYLMEISIRLSLCWKCHVILFPFCFFCSSSTAFFYGLQNKNKNIYRLPF